MSDAQLPVPQPLAPGDTIRDELAGSTSIAAQLAATRQLLTIHRRRGVLPPPVAQRLPHPLRQVQVARLGAFRLEVAEHHVTLPRWPAAFDGLRVAHLTDIHRGPYMPQFVVERLVDICNDLAPDIVALTGDYVYGPNWLGHRQGLRALGRLQARLGVFATLGNHDWRYRASQRITRELEDFGIAVLENRHAVIAEAGLRLGIVGVQDQWVARPCLTTALKGLHADALLMLSHNPDTFEDRRAMGTPGLMPSLGMAGHTHGGQVVIPRVGTPHMNCAHPRYMAGLVQGPHFPVYVSRGLGMVAVPLRMNCPAELPVLVLHSQHQA